MVTQVSHSPLHLSCSSLDGEDLVRIDWASRQDELTGRPLVKTIAPGEQTFALERACFSYRTSQARSYLWCTSHTLSHLKLEHDAPQNQPWRVAPGAHVLRVCALSWDGPFRRTLPSP